jgi:hypothetical protein
MSTYTPIASVTLSSAQASVTFSSIPQTYTDLVLVVNGSTATSTGNMGLRFNSNASNIYGQVRILGDGTSPSTERQSTQSSAGIGDWGTDTSNLVINIRNYTNTAINKAVISRSNTLGFVSAYASLWSNTSAITSVTVLKEDGNNLTSGTTVNLYGIANASITNTAKATGGDSVYTDGTYWYHTFISSGTFTPTQSLTADYLVVAGGGAGVGNSGGGGGAGGMRCTVTGTGGSGSLESPLSLTAQAYTVTVGAGGAGASALNNIRGANGSNSVFATITSTGGGGGGNRLGGSPIGNGATGGSGGGSAVDGYTGGAASPSGQGFAGGSAPGATNPGGGGGGAAAVGQDGGTANLSGGDGGAGRATSISGTSTFYAGGGGGAYNLSGSGEGGVGGGASAPTTGNTGGNNGTANTGGGGSAGNGGAGTGNNGGSGGSGIVIVRYAV